MYDEENETKENERNGFIFIEDLFPEIKQLISDEVRRQSEKNPNTPILNESVMRNMIHHVNYPKMGLYYHRYKDYLSAPVKLVLDIYLARGYIVHAYLVNEGDQIIDEVYIPARPNNGFVTQVSNLRFAKEAAQVWKLALHAKLRRSNTHADVSSRP